VYSDVAHIKLLDRLENTNFLKLVALQIGTFCQGSIRRHILNYF
jgi:hypothetical protein